MKQASVPRWVSGGLLVLAACGPTAARPRTADDPPRLEQALRPEHVARRYSETSIVELRVVFEAGSKDDPKGREGLTYVMLRSMLEGGAGGMTYAERVARLFPMAGEIRARVGREQIVFIGRVHVDHVDAFYPLFRDVLLRPTFEHQTFERVRAQALSSLTQGLRGGDDEQLGKELLQAMLFEGHPYAHPELGYERALARLRPADVSAQWARLLCADRVRVGLGGPRHPEMEQALLDDLAALRRPACAPKRPLPEPVSQVARRMWIVEKPSASAVAISAGLPVDVARGDPDYPALVVAAAYLGQHRTFAGRLMQKIRVDRGMNYGDYAYAEHFEQAGSTRFPAPNVARRKQYFSVWLRPLDPKQAQFALRLAARELTHLVEHGMSEDELERIREFILGYFALFEQTQQMRLGNALDDLFYDLRGPYLEQLLAGVRELTASQLRQALSRSLDLTALQIAVVAPDAEAFQRETLAESTALPEYTSDKPQALHAEDREVAGYALGLLPAQIRVMPVDRAF